MDEAKMDVNQSSTWKQAQPFALEWAEKLLSVHPGEKTIWLPDYLEATAYCQLGELNGWTWEFWRVVRQATERELSRQRVECQRIPIVALDYIDWLQRTGRPEGPVTAGEFLNGKMDCERAWYLAKLPTSITLPNDVTLRLRTPRLLIKGNRVSSWDGWTEKQAELFVGPARLRKLIGSDAPWANNPTLPATASTNLGQPFGATVIQLGRPRSIKTEAGEWQLDPTVETFGDHLPKATAQGSG